jgi:hypothetical protein
VARSVWACVDCGTEVAEVGREIRRGLPNEEFEYCWRCKAYEPRVKIEYR